MRERERTNELGKTSFLNFKMACLFFSRRLLYDLHVGLSMHVKPKAKPRIRHSAVLLLKQSIITGHTWVTRNHLSVTCSNIGFTNQTQNRSVRSDLLSFSSLNLLLWLTSNARLHQPVQYNVLIITPHTAISSSTSFRAILFFVVSPCVYNETSYVAE